MNVSGKYLKVWKVEDKGTVKIVDLGDSRKDRQGAYENCTWFGCLFCGSAAQKPIQEGDKINVTSGQIFQEKYEGKYYTKVKVFHFETENQGMSESSPFARGSADRTVQTTQDVFSGEKFEDDIPF